ncbi:secreted protein [Candidatus Magnetoovum chiemensis]|nr:secreted protein [Candidatus Magnetoovum chiemensis]
MKNNYFIKKVPMFIFLCFFAVLLVSKNGFCQEGLLPAELDPSKVYYFAYKAKTTTQWGRLAGGLEYAGFYIGSKDGQSYILETTGEPNTPPTLETVGEFLARIDGNVDEIVWANFDADIENFDIFFISEWLSTQPAYYPTIDQDGAEAILGDLDALEEKISDFFTESSYFEKKDVQNFIASFGVKDPIAENLGLPSMYNSQLIYLYYKYGADIDVEANSPQFIVDIYDKLVTPIEILLNPNTSIIYNAQFNEVGVPTIKTKIDARGKLYIEISPPEGSSKPEGYVGIIEDTAGDMKKPARAIYFTIPGDWRQIIIPSLPQGKYKISVAAFGNLNPILFPQNYTNKPNNDTADIQHPSYYNPSTDVEYPHYPSSSNSGSPTSGG